MKRKGEKEVFHPLTQYCFRSMWSHIDFQETSLELLCARENRSSTKSVQNVNKHITISFGCASCNQIGKKARGEIMPIFRIMIGKTTRIVGTSSSSFVKRKLTFHLNNSFFRSCKAPESVKKHPLASLDAQPKSASFRVQMFSIFLFFVLDVTFFVSRASLPAGLVDHYFCEPHHLKFWQNVPKQSLPQHFVHERYHKFGMCKVVPKQSLPYFSKHEHLHRFDNPFINV